MLSAQKPHAVRLIGTWICRYFRTYLRIIADHKNLQISVHCDVLVFSWLLQWAKAQHGQAELPIFSIWNCLQIMISSEFLQVGDCPPCECCTTLLVITPIAITCPGLVAPGSNIWLPASAAASLAPMTLIRCDYLHGFAPKGCNCFHQAHLSKCIIGLCTGSKPSYAPIDGEVHAPCTD